MQKTIYLIALLFIFQKINAQKDIFQVELYKKIHDSEIQQKFRKLAPMPAGVVYIQQPNEGEKEMREHFRNMKKLGFNSLKQIMNLPTWTIEQISKIALEEEIIPWWYGEGGFESITDELLSKLGIPLNSSVEEILKNPKMIEYQFKLMNERISRTEQYISNSPEKKFMRVTSVAYDPEIGGRGLELTPKGEELFFEWLKNKYKTIDTLNKAWNQYHAGLFLNEHRLIQSWEDLKKNWKNISNREYNHVKDIYRFKVEHNLSRINEAGRAFLNFDPNAPYRGGGEMGLFHPFAWYGVNMEGIAEIMKNYGSFYPSMHFSWHFDLVKGEISKSLYQQASLMNDLNKGGWTGGWESSGGPQQLDGERNPQHQNSFFVGSNELKRLYLSQIAAGFKGFGIWCWNSRSAGKEGGEYSLLDRNGQITERAIEIGKIAKAMQKYRFELWEATKEPTVGVLYDWENEATWAAMSISGRESYKLESIKARVGISNALIGANVPFEYVTPTDLTKGLKSRYQIIYLPAFLTIDRSLLKVLKEYVSEGGKLFFDLPGGWYDENTQNLNTAKGSDFEQLFGTIINDFQYSGTNHNISINNHLINGFVIDAKPTTGRVLLRYNNQKPAVIVNSLGNGKAYLIGSQLSLNLFENKNNNLLSLVTKEITPEFECKEATVYRLASKNADHYFLMNENQSKSVYLQFKSIRYKKFTNAVTGQNIDPKKIFLKSNDSIWIRADK